MASVGPNNAGTGAEDAVNSLPLDLIWIAPNNITDGNYALTFSDAGGNYGSTRMLAATNFGFSVPTDATINGLFAEVNGYTNRSRGDERCTVEVIQAYKTGYSLVGNNKAASGGISEDTTIATYFPYGGSSDLWGTTWTPSDVNSSEFGLGVRFYLDGIGPGQSIGLFVGYIRITITYTSASSSVPQWQIRGVGSITIG
jgi:hypothetical protein